MSVIGKQIKKYRMEKNITQEQLGKLVGVTTQAVSKWERGGTPDAELLPALARTLNVSIDALFGNEQQSETLTLARQLRGLSREEAFKYAFDLCWALEIGLMQQDSLVSSVFSQFLEHDEFLTPGFDYFSKIQFDSGITTMRVSPNFHYFFLMPEPEGGIKQQLADRESLRRVFEIFADEKLLKIIFYMYSRLNKPIATSLISKNTGLSTVEVDRCMTKLCETHLATCEVIDAAEGKINAYLFHQESSVIPLLWFADEISKKVFRDVFVDLDRSKPLLH